MLLYINFLKCKFFCIEKVINKDFNILDFRKIVFIIIRTILLLIFCMENNDFSKIKLNTIELEKGLYPNWKIEDFCDTIVSWEEFDNNPEFFSEKNKKEAFWDNYKSVNEIEITETDWSKSTRKIPSIIAWWMWTNVSSASLVEWMNKLWFWWHLSSIGIGFYYYQKKYPELFTENFTWVNELKEIVKKDFDIVFKECLWLEDEFIKKHFFVCNDLWESEKNIGFNWELWLEKLVRMMDLVSIYHEVIDLYEKGNNVWINCMYKTSSYIAALKISMLCWMDYITTAAWNPEVNPKKFLKSFLQDLKKEWREVELPAFWLLVSSWRKQVFSDLDYDYYTFEEWALAWGHIIRMWDKFEWLKKIRELFEKAGKKIPPIYAAAWTSTNKDIREAFDAWFDWVQIWTLPAVSQEACNGEWDEFKERLIWWNHIWENTEIDEKFFAWVDEVKWNFEKIVEDFNAELLSILEQKESTWESPEIKRVRDYLYKVVYNAFFQEEIKSLDELSVEEQEYYNTIKEFFFTKYEWDMKKINKVFRNAWNAMKFLQEFEKFVSEKWEKPTHMVFDSTVWFPWRTKIAWNIHEVVAWEVKSNWCINCLTDCILAWRWSVREDRGSTFCIYNRLNYLNPDKDISFSWRSTVPYSEIRPIKDIMAYLMWTYVDR